MDGEALHVWELQELPDGCRLVQHGDMRPTRLGWLIAPLMPLIVRRQLHDCARRLTHALERRR